MTRSFNLTNLDEPTLRRIRIVAAHIEEDFGLVNNRTLIRFLCQQYIKTHNLTVPEEPDGDV